jgi:hypothetical protein
MRSCLNKEKSYDLRWDSFYEIKEYDLKRNNSTPYFQPIDLIKTNLYDVNLRILHPI